MREKERESQLASCSLLCVWQRTSLWSHFYLLRERETESEIVSLVGTLSRQFLITHTPAINKAQHIEPKSKH